MPKQKRKLDLFSVLLVALFITVTTAQPPLPLVGVWQVDVISGVSFTLTLNADGSYLLEEAGSTKKGTWQSDGAVLSLEQQELLTGATTGEAYRLELYENELLLSGEGSLTQFSLSGSITFNRFILPPTFTDDSSDNTWIVGDWQTVTDNFATARLSFSPDGSYTLAIPAQNYYGEGSWQLSGNQLHHSWQDPNTGQQQATYTLQRPPDEKTFVMAGGDLGATVLTFARASSQAVSEPAPQPQASSSFAPPQSGSYACYVMTVGAPITTYTYSPTLGSIPVLTPTYVPSPSVLGTLTLDENGTYSSGFGSGSYSYDAGTNSVTFSAPLGNLPVRYRAESGSYTLTFTYRVEEGSQDHTCSLEP